MDDKKAFFARKTTAEIKEGKEPLILENKIVAALQELQQNQYAIIPETSFGARFGDPAKFLKHGDTFELHNNRHFGKTPGALFREAVTNPQTSFNIYMSGYSFKPRLGRDRVPRRVPFVELLEAARILAYGQEYPGTMPRIIGEYSSAVKAAMEGGSFMVSTPSRSRKHHRYNFIISGVPMRYSEPFVYLIPYNFDSEYLGVKSKAFRELRFTHPDNPESSKFNYIHAHEIAAAYTVAEEQLKKKNRIPLRFLVFPVVSQSAVNLYTTLLNRTLLQVEEEGKIKHNHLTQAHQEAIMWRLVRKHGYDSGFDDTALLEGRVRNYNWNNHV